MNSEHLLPYRCAVYFVPEVHSDWWQAGSRWLGRCAASGTTYPPPVIDGVEATAAIRALPDSTRAGLPIGVGEPAINPVPRQMMRDVVETACNASGVSADIEITISVGKARPLVRELLRLGKDAVLALDRRITRDGMVSVGGNLYSVPDGIGRRVVEVHSLANEIHIFNDGALLVVHPVLEGKNQRRVAPGHRPVAHRHLVAIAGPCQRALSRGRRVAAKTPPTQGCL